LPDFPTCPKLNPEQASSKKKKNTHGQNYHFLP
jgi:hypothetical protein